MKKLSLFIILGALFLGNQAFAQSFNGSLCPSELQLSQNLRTGAYNGKYHSYTKGTVTQAHILQKHLNRLGFSSGKEDGKLGPISDGAIKRMQQFLGLSKIDGIVGPNTRAALNNSCGVETTSSTSTVVLQDSTLLSSQIQDITDTTATISWIAAAPIIATVEYGTHLNSLSEEVETNTTSVELSKLKSETTYYYHIVGTDNAGNILTSKIQSFSTLSEEETEAPEIIELTKTPTGTSAVKFDWSINKGVTGQIDYGVTEALGTLSTKENSFLDRHVQYLYNLLQNTTYFYKILGEDEYGNSITSSIESFIPFGSDEELDDPEDEEDVNEPEFDGDTYNFNPDNWGIVQGVVSDAVALNNRIKFNEAIIFAKEGGADTFEVPDMDVYVDVRADDFGKHTRENTIMIPSDFHIKMSDNTHLRTQPNAEIAGTILMGYNVSNIKISGGHLWGDRYTHTYRTGTSQNTHEFGSSIFIVSVHNAIIEDVELRENTGDGIQLFGAQSRNDNGTVKPGKMQNNNIIIRNNHIEKNRRNNISMIDGTNILIEGNTIINGGDGGDWSPSEGYNWKGVLPRYNIDFEATRRLGDDGVTRVLGQLNRYITVRDNIFYGAHNGDLDLFTVDNIDIYDNTFGSMVADVQSNDVTIHDNVFEADSEDRIYAILLSSFKKTSQPNLGEELNVRHKVYNNTITGYKHAITVGGNEKEVYNNTITDFKNTGIFIGNGENNEFHDNVIESHKPNTRGYYHLPISGSLEGNIIEDEEIDVTEYGILLINVQNLNNSSGLVIDNVDIKAGFRGIDLRTSNNVTVKNSNIENGIYYDTSTNISLNNNS